MEINDSLDRLRTTLYTFVVFHPINENNKEAEGSHFGAGIPSMRKGLMNVPQCVLATREQSLTYCLVKEKFFMHYSQIGRGSVFESYPGDQRP